MRRGKSGTKALPKRDSALRLAISLFVMLAFGLQSYISQTHIHLKPDTFSYSKLSHDSGKQDPSDHAEFRLRQL